MMVNEIGTILLGIVGGIIGAIAVNYVSYKLQKREERSEEVRRTEVEYQKEIQAKLTELEDTWKNELAKNHVNRNGIQNDFDIFSNQLTAMVPRAPDNFPRDILQELRELCGTLKSLSDFIPGSGPENYQEFIKECEKRVAKAKRIRQKLENNEEKQRMSRAS